MSKSYKYPIYTDYGNHTSFFKKRSNKKIRKWLKQLNIGFKSSHIFKIIENQYNICDYKFYSNTEKAKRK